MTDFKFVGSCNVFPTIPKAGRWFNGAEVGEGGNQKYNPPNEGVQTVKSLHKRVFYQVVAKIAIISYPAGYSPAERARKCAALSFINPTHTQHPKPLDALP